MKVPNNPYDLGSGEPEQDLLQPLVQFVSVREHSGDALSTVQFDHNIFQSWMVDISEERCGARESCRIE